MTKEDIIETRNKLGLNQKEMAYLLGVSYNTYTKWETGHRNPTTSAQRLIELVGLVGEHAPAVLNIWHE